MNLLGHFVAEFDAPQLEFEICESIKRERNLKVTGLIDTGANRVCISESLAQRARLKSIRSVLTTTASGVVESKIYAARVKFSDLDFAANLEVVAPQTPDYEPPILIGMSVLRQFNIGYHGGLGTWSFYRRED